jgi:tetratricopeptide (TPR) repeat protein
MNVFEGLERLMNNNLLKPSEENHGELRMRQFETVRDFAREHLLRSGRAEVVAGRYRQYFLRLAQRAEPALAQPSHQSWRERLDAELDNLRAVMSSAIETGRSDEALRIATALWRFWWRYGHWNEGLQWLKAGLHAPDPLPPELKAEALTRAGWLCRFMGDFPQSIAFLQESIPLWQQTSDPRGHAMALANLGASMIRSADVERGVALTQRALELAEQHGDTAGTSFSLQVLGHAAALQGNTRRALELYERALTLALQVGDDDHSANVLNALAEEHMTEGDYEQAEACLSRAATIAARLGNRFVSTYTSGNRGAIALQKGNYAQAFDLFSETLLALQEMGDRENAILCLEAFAYIANRGHLWDRAVKLLAANDALRQVVGFSHSTPMQADYDAAVAEARGQLDAQAFQAAWAEGTALAYDRAIAYAVDKSWRPGA